MFGYEIAIKYAEQSTVRNPKSEKQSLPFGFIQSSIIASLCLYKSALGRVIADCARNPDLAVSVYVDDIILSSKDKQILDAATLEVQSAATRSLFKLNKAKEIISSPKITAFNVELTTNELFLTQERLRQFSEILEANPSNRIKKGILGYIETVNPGQATALAQNMEA